MNVFLKALAVGSLPAVLLAASLPIAAQSNPTPAPASAAPAGVAQTATNPALFKAAQASFEASIDNRLAGNELNNKIIKEVKFDKAPLRDICAYLQAQFPEINIVMNEEAEDEVIFSLRLRSVTVRDFLIAIELATNGRVVGKSVSDTMIAFQSIKHLGQAGPKLCRAFSLQSYLAGKANDAERDEAMQRLENALEECWALLHHLDRTPFENPHLSFNSGLKLLIAIGDSDHLAVVEEVARELNGNAAPPGGDPLGNLLRNSSRQHKDPADALSQPPPVKPPATK